ncbi:hypothetical protein, partial [Pseudorhodobacter sp.]|uniref:hypothetical protein n=1 Tax=Pseudorhodobacter sp. TaxID=1934400 RepID=UPI0026487D49
SGTVRIIDRLKPLPHVPGRPYVIGAPPEYETTIYKKTAGGNLTVRSNTSGISQILIGADSTAYNPVDDAALFFTKAKDHEVSYTSVSHVKETYFCIANINCGSVQDGPATPVGTDVISDVLLANKPDVGYVKIAADNIDATPYRFSSVRRIGEVDETVTNGPYTNVVNFPFSNQWQKREHDITTTRSFTERRTMTHRLQADLPISIEFDGYTTSRAEVVADGSILLDRSIRALNGQVNLTSGGDILALQPEVIIQTSDTRLTARNGRIGGVSPSSFKPRVFRIVGPVAARDIFGRVTGADLTAGETPYRNELIGAARASAAEDVLLVSGESVGVTATALHDIRLRNPEGELLVGRVESTFGHDVQLEAKGSIRPAVFGGQIIGGDVRLLSESGSIGVEATQPYGDVRLDVEAEGTLYVDAYADIDLRSLNNRMGIEQVRSATGDVRLETAQFNIEDEDRRETADRRAQADLLQALWDELGLVDDAALTQPTTAEIQTGLAPLIDQEAQAYFAWWDVLVERDSKGAITGINKYDPALVLDLTAAERRQLVAKGADDEKINAIVTERTLTYHAQADRYANTDFDANFVYQPTATEKNAVRAMIQQDKLNNNPLIQREIESRTASYFEWFRASKLKDQPGFDPHHLLGGQRAPYYYTPERRREMLASGLTNIEIDQLQADQNARFNAQSVVYNSMTFDPNYRATIDAREAAELIKGAYFTTTELEASFRRDLILPVTDTQITIEEPNVIGRNVTLLSGQDIGERIDPIIKAAGSKLSREDRLVLFTAARADIMVNEGNVIINRNDDLDVEATGELVVDAARNAYVGSELDVYLRQFEAMRDARLRSSGAITTADPNGRGVVGQSVLLEAAGGDIGSLNAPMPLEILNGGALNARADGSIYLRAEKSDIPLDEIFAKGTVWLESGAGSILDANPTSDLELLAAGVHLRANGMIGAGDGVDVALSAPGGRVFVESGADLDLRVTGGDILLERAASVAGDVTLTTDGAIKLVHPATPLSANEAIAIAAFGDITVTAEGEITETQGLFSSVKAGGRVELTAAGAIGSADRNLVVNAPELGLRVMDIPGASAFIQAYGNLSIGRLLLGTGDGLITTTGALRTGFAALSANSLTLRTLGEPGEGSDILFGRSFNAVDTVVTAESAQDIILADGVQIGFGKAASFQAGLRETGSIIERGPSRISAGAEGLALAATGDIRLGMVRSAGELHLSAEGDALAIQYATAAQIDVVAGAQTEVQGRFDANLIAFEGGQIGFKPAPVLLGGTNTGVRMETAGSAYLNHVGNGALHVRGASIGGNAMLTAAGRGIVIDKPFDVAGDVQINSGALMINENLRSRDGSLALTVTDGLTVAQGKALSAARHATLSAGGAMQLGDVTSGADVSLTAATIQAWQGTKVQAGGTLALRAGAAGTGAVPLIFNAANLMAEGVGNGQFALHSDGPVALLRLSGTLAQFDLVSDGDLLLGRSIAPIGDSRVILTSRGGDIGQLDGVDTTQMEG